MAGAAETELISVIVPVYKVEKYLHQCVDSILNQTYENLEVILVDDGSPDNCPCICDEYAEKDKRVRVIHKPNGGLSDARNAGMKDSQGKYLMFVDSDDWMPEDAVGYLFGLMHETGADLVIGGNCRVYDETGIPVSSVEDRVTLMGPAQAMQDFFTNGCAAWARLYRNKIHDGIEFPVGEINEDEAVVLQLLERCKKVTVSTRCVYFYRCREESITTAEFGRKKLLWVKHCHDNLKWIEARAPELTPYAEKRYFSSISWSLYGMAPKEREFGEIPNQLRGELRGQWRKVLTSKRLPVKEKIKMIMEGFLWPVLRFYIIQKGRKTGHRRPHQA